YGSLKRVLPVIPSVGTPEMSDRHVSNRVTRLSSASDRYQMSTFSPNGRSTAGFGEGGGLPGGGGGGKKSHDWMPPRVRGCSDGRVSRLRWSYEYTHRPHRSW